MDRFEEFQSIIGEKIKNSSDSEPILRNRLGNNNNNTENNTKNIDDEKNSEGFSELNESIYSFSNDFVSQCSLLNDTLVQLNRKLTELPRKMEIISFTTTTTAKPENKLKEIEEALNICSMNISILRKKLSEKESQAEGIYQREKGTGYFTWFTTSPATTTTSNSQKSSNPILEHDKLILFFLESRIGKISGDLDFQQRRKRERERILTKSARVHGSSSVNSAHTSNLHSRNIVHASSDPSGLGIVQHDPSHDIASTATQSAHQIQLQVENSRMIEEMSRGIFESLSNTETQILEISRLQNTLQTHLTIQHDQTVRLFEDSLEVIRETRKGNEYLRRSGQDGSMFRKFLVVLILVMTLILIFLHYYN